MDAWMDDGMMDDDGWYLKQRIGSWHGIHKCVLVLPVLLAVTVACVVSLPLPRVFILLLCENWQVCLRGFTNQAKNKNEKAAVALERGHLYKWIWFKQISGLTVLWTLTDVAWGRRITWCCESTPLLFCLITFMQFEMTEIKLESLLMWKDHTNHVAAVML